MPLKEGMSRSGPAHDLVTGEDEGADEDGMVTLSSARRGGGHVQVRHWHSGGGGDRNALTVKLDDNAYIAPVTEVPEVNDDTKEWNTVEITFKWDAGEPPIDMGTVTASYAPVSR